MRRVYLLPLPARLGAHVVYYAERENPHTHTITRAYAGPRVRRPRRFNVCDYAARETRHVCTSEYGAFVLEAARLRALLGRRR